MDPAVRLASTVADPLVSQLLLPVEATPDNAQTEDELLARLVSFRGEAPPMSYESLLSLVGELVALTAAGYRLLPQDEAPVAGVLRCLPPLVVTIYLRRCAPLGGAS